MKQILGQLYGGTQGNASSTREVMYWICASQLRIDEIVRASKDIDTLSGLPRLNGPQCIELIRYSRPEIIVLI